MININLPCDPKLRFWCNLDDDLLVLWSSQEVLIECNIFKSTFVLSEYKLTGMILIILFFPLKYRFVGMKYFWQTFWQNIFGGFWKKSGSIALSDFSSLFSIFRFNLSILFQFSIPYHFLKALFSFPLAGICGGTCGERPLLSQFSFIGLKITWWCFSWGSKALEPYD